MTCGVYPPMFHYLRKYGMYVFRFYKNNGWRYVIIDDKLPCYNKRYGDAELVFGRCRSINEFWVPLIEKAYAKIHQCYEALISGFIDDGLTDMTAFAQTKIIFKKKGSNVVRYNRQKNDKAKAELWKFMLQSNKNKSLMGCSALGTTEGEVIYPEDVASGVLSGHAYSIIDVFEIKAQIADENGDLKPKLSKLVPLRNPWGKKEWVGAWSDGSEELLDNLVVLSTYVNKCRQEGDEDMQEFLEEASDGTFLMNFEDWR